MEECFKLVEKVVSEYLPEFVLQLKNNQVAKETFSEICSLLADVNEIAPTEIVRSFKEEMHLCTPSVLLIIVRPAMDHLFAAYISGAYPLCYHPLRISTEALAYSLYIDMNGFSTSGDAFEKLNELQEHLDDKHLPMSSFIKDKLGKVVGEELSQRINQMWKQISNDFLHFKGYLIHLNEYVNSDIDAPPPSYAVGAFVSYDDADKPGLCDLKETVNAFRELVKEIWDFWKSRHVKN